MRKKYKKGWLHKKRSFLHNFYARTRCSRFCLFCGYFIVRYRCCEGEMLRRTATLTVKTKHCALSLVVSSCIAELIFPLYVETCSHCRVICDRLSMYVQGSMRRATKERGAQCPKPIKGEWWVECGARLGVSLRKPRDAGKSRKR